jgi:hypothetical protein
MQLSGEDDDVLGTCSVIDLWWLRNLAGEVNVLEIDNCYEPLLAQQAKDCKITAYSPAPYDTSRACLLPCLNIIVQMTRLTLSIFGGVLSNTCDLTY